MTKILVEKAVIEQALGALVRAEQMYGQPNADIQTALREALAEPQRSKEVLCVKCGQPTMHMGDKCYACCQTTESAEQKPAAVMEVFSGWSDVADVEILYHAAKKLPDGEYKLYTAPVRTKDLTDDDLEKTYDEICRNASSSERLLFRYGRAVIAADRKKNNV